MYLTVNKEKMLCCLVLALWTITLIILCNTCIEKVFPPPGWTIRGHRVYQCTDSGGERSPIGGVACPTPGDFAHAQDHGSTTDPGAMIMIFIVFLYLMSVS